MVVHPVSELFSKTSEHADYPQHLKDAIITGVSTSSAQVREGHVFVALKGEKLDGAQFISDAELKGAILAICKKGSEIPAVHIPVIQVENPRLMLAELAAAFYPKQPEHIVAITGTDGKTSTADFFRQFIALAGKKSASMGTLGVIDGHGKNLYPGTLTTPDAVEMQRILAELAQGGTQHVAIEASSHGLHQYRLHGVKLEAAAFTNIARDHLDYHQNEENYFAAKTMLFSQVLPAEKTAVLNADDAKFSELKKICESRNHRVISFGKNGTELTIEKVTPHAQGQRLELTAFGKNHVVDIPLVGGFQVMNILASLGLIVGTGGDVEEYLGYIPKLAGVPGRLELVATLNNGASIFIDYAHTPTALANILQTLRPHTENKLHVVFGCGGDRDAGKRPLMGKAASELADVVIVTDDNPRTEDANSIRAAVMAGAGEKATEIADRKLAIYGAIAALEAGDVLVIAGKGHEKMQIIGKEHVPFDDAQVAIAGAQA